MKIQFRSKNEIVYEQLRKSIINGDYQAGTRLVIDQIAADLGVSQIPIREAVRQLEADGFVTIEPYTGATITEINPTLIFEIFALLENLEVICSRGACDKITAQELDQLALLVDEMDTSIDQPEIWSGKNKEFHLAIGEYSRFTLANGMLRKAIAHWDRLRFYYLKDVLGLRIKNAQQEHHQILQAMRQRDPDKVEMFIRQHNQRAFASYSAYLRSIGELAADTEPQS
jgi:DNA-binding GntR family transcriptional regulator